MEVLYSSDYVTEIFLMTGGIVESSRFAKLLPYNDKTRIMFNVNERDSYRNPSHHSIVERNIQEAVSLGLRVCVGFNIYHQDFDGEQIIDLCIRHGINHLRFAVACPIYGSGSHQTVVPASEYNVISDKVFDFLMKCFSAGIEAVLDCPLPLCFFSDAQLGVLSKTQSGVVSRIGKCTPPVDIDFDLTLMRCFSIGSHVGKKKLTDFSSFIEIRQYFIHEVDSPDSCTMPVNICFFFIRRLSIVASSKFNYNIKSRTSQLICHSNSITILSISTALNFVD
jgi:cyclic pyranopterin phosphate synthase